MGRSAASFVLLCLATPAMALQVQNARVVFNPGKTDTVHAAGRMGDLPLETVETLHVVVDGVGYDVPVERLVRKKQTVRYRGKRGMPGVRLLVVDQKRRTFRVELADVVLGTPASPLTFELVANTTADCGLLSLAEKVRRGGRAGSAAAKRPRPRKFALATRSGHSNACAVAAPSFAPHPLLIGDPSSVVATVAIPGTVEAGSVRLSSADAVGFPTGDALCTPTDDGQSGDVVAGDGRYGCTLTLDTAAPSHVAVVASATMDGAVVRSVPAVLEVLEPLTDAAAQIVVDVQARAGAIWSEKEQAFGDSLRARLETVAALRGEPGVASVHLVDELGSIAITYASGVHGGLGLTPRVLLDAAAPAAVARAAAAMIRPAAVELPPDDAVVVGNRRVLIWDPGFFFSDTEVEYLRRTFEESTCPRFDVTMLQNEAATLESLQALTTYGSVALVSHGTNLREFNCMQVREAVTRELLVAHADAVQRRQLVPVAGARSTSELCITARFVKNLPGTFKDALLWGGYCHSGLDVSTLGEDSTPDPTRTYDALVNAYTAKGVGAYYGYTRVVSSDFAINLAPRIFPGLLNESRTTQATFDAIEPKWDRFQVWNRVKHASRFEENTVDDWPVFASFAPGAARLVLRPTGGKPLVYLKPALTPKDPTVDPEGEQQFEIVVEGADECTLLYRWRNTGTAGHLGGGDDTQDTTPTRTYVANDQDTGEDTVTVDVIDNAATPARTLYTLTTKVALGCTKCAESGGSLNLTAARGVCIPAEVCCKDEQDNDSDGDTDCDDDDCRDDPTCANLLFSCGAAPWGPCMTRPVAGAPVTRLFSTPERVSFVAAAPLGNRIAYSVGPILGLGAPADLTITDLDGSNATPVPIPLPGRPEAVSRMRSLAWSRDGTQLAFTLGRSFEINGTPTGLQLYVVDANGSNSHLVSQLQAGTFAVCWPSSLGLEWSPDGTQIAFGHDDCVGVFAGGTSGIDVVTVATGVVQRLIGSDDEAYRWPTFSPDGRTLAFVGGLGSLGTENSLFNVYTYDLDPEPNDPPPVPVQITTYTTAANPLQGLRWSPAGDRLAFWDFGAGGSNLQVMDSTGGNGTTISYQTGRGALAWVVGSGP